MRSGRLTDQQVRQKVLFIVAAALVGASTGLVAASFRLSLHWAAHRREAAQHWAHDHGAVGLVLLLVGAGLAAAVAAALVRWVEPHAEGSGIPRIEAIVDGRTALGRARILPVKFVGGVLSIGAGLALGREGPSVQMGGSVAGCFSRAFHLQDRATRTLVAAGAAAGLATAFNAPLAGAVFVLEELVKRFEHRSALATLTASASGFAVSHLLVRGYEFHVATPAVPRLAQAPSVVLVGLLCGLVGLVHNRGMLAGLAWADRSRIPRELRAAAVGVAVGLLGWWSPVLVGGGEELTGRALAGHGTLLLVLGTLVLRLVLGIVSYAALTPGGLFAPMLVLGSELGVVVGLAGQAVLPAVTAPPASLALVGFAAFFAATVRAPVTGLVLATEMTGVATLLPPMLGACAVAMLVSTVLRSEPIYDMLAARAAHAARLNEAQVAPGGSAGSARA